MSNQNIEELNPSDLGTLDFWEKTYTEELDNFKDHGDVGEIWFGRNATLKVVKWISRKMNLDKEIDKIIDVGCGNGMTLVELANEGFEHLTGVDYSQKAIDLATEVLNENNISRVELQVCDILDPNISGLPLNYFKIVHDKGTYDAISLHPDEPTVKRLKYIENIQKILQTDGYLVLTSCNWTESELRLQFKDHFEFVTLLPADSFQFGGKTGNTVTQIIFKRK